MVGPLCMEGCLGRLRWISEVCLILKPILMYKMTRIPMGKMKKMNEESSCSGYF